MTIYVIFIAMTAVTLAALVFPLLRPGNTDTATRTDYARAIYRDQLAELEHETARGLTPPEYVEATRLEIRRRILASADNEKTLLLSENPYANRILAMIIMLAVSIGGGVLYNYLGSPGLPDKPFATRQNDPDIQMNAAADIVAGELEAQPDAERYKKHGEAYYRLRPFDRAADAYHKAVALDTQDAAAWSRLGESIVMANDGAVTMEAQDAFKSALAQDAHEPRARYYMGLAEAEIGNLRTAVAIWRGIEKNAPPDAPWLPMVKESIASTAKQGGFDPASVAPTPP